MFFVYADVNGEWESIYNPFDDARTIHSPKVTLELGKTGSFQFNIPMTNEYYRKLEQLKTKILVTYDDKWEIFRGRVLSITRGYSNMKSVYCEGMLAYLVDSVQKATSYDGYTKALFNKIIDKHNSIMSTPSENAYKKFYVGHNYMDDVRVVIPGKKDDDDKYYGTDKYAQAIIESINDEWLNTYDYINDIFIDYLGGYLVARYDDSTNRNYIDYITIDSLNEKVAAARAGSVVRVPTIEYGESLIDFTEEIKAEELFTVLVPLGDSVGEKAEDQKVLTIEGVSSTIKNKYASKYGNDLIVVDVGGKQIGLADRRTLEKYGKIVKTFSFSNVNDKETLYRDAARYLSQHRNIPTLYTIKGVDLALLNDTQNIISIGEAVHIVSEPHDVDLYLACTKIDYDLENPGNTSYTFGNPEQTLTDRYKKDKDKEKKKQKHHSSKSGNSGAAAGEEVDKLNKGFTEFKQYCDDTYAETSMVTGWHDGLVESLASFKQYCDSKYAQTEIMTKFTDGMSEALASFTQYATDTYAETDMVTKWHNESVTSLAEFKQHCEATYAKTEILNSFISGTTESMANFVQTAADTYAETDMVTKWHNESVTSLAEFKQHCEATYAKTEILNSFISGTTESMANFVQTAADTYAETDMVTKWHNESVTSLAEFKQHCEATYAKTEILNSFINGATEAFANFTQYAGEKYAETDMVTKWHNESVTSLAEFKQYCDSNYAHTDILTKFTDGINTAKADFMQYAASTYAKTDMVTQWKDEQKDALARLTMYVDAHHAALDMFTKFKTKKDGSLASSEISMDSDGLHSLLELSSNYQKDVAGQIAAATADIKMVSDNNKAVLEMLTDYTSKVVDPETGKLKGDITTGTNRSELSTKLLSRISDEAVFTYYDATTGKTAESKTSITEIVNKAGALISLVADYKDEKNGKFTGIEIKDSAAKSIITMRADQIKLLANAEIKGYLNVTGSITAGGPIFGKGFKSDGFSYFQKGVEFREGVSIVNSTNLAMTGGAINAGSTAAHFKSIGVQKWTDLVKETGSYSTTQTLPVFISSKIAEDVTGDYIKDKLTTNTVRLKLRGNYDSMLAYILKVLGVASVHKNDSKSSNESLVTTAWVNEKLKSYISSSTFNNHQHSYSKPTTGTFTTAKTSKP